MALRRTTGQCNGDPLEKTWLIFAEPHRQASLRQAAQQMLEFLPVLDTALGQRDVWALTSHMRLILLPTNSTSSPWLVAIEPWPGRRFEISYRMPADEAPWPLARVVGEADNFETACAMVKVAMEQSRGSPPNAQYPERSGSR